MPNLLIPLLVALWLVPLAACLVVAFVAPFLAWRGAGW